MVGAAQASVAPGDYCVVGVGPTTAAVADGWLAIVTPGGGVTDITPSLTTALIDPWDCAIDPTNGDVIIVDEGPNGAGTNGVVYRVSIVGAAVTQTTLYAGAPLVNPFGVAVGSDGTIYLSDMGATYEERDIPEDLQDLCAGYREKLVESAAEATEELMEKYLEKGDLDIDDIKAGIRQQTLANEIVPA